MKRQKNFSQIKNGRGKSLVDLAWNAPYISIYIK
jgi:hypothetical protein